MGERDYDLLDDGEFQRIREWNRVRIEGGVYRLADYRVSVLIDHLGWLIRYTLHLRGRIRESESVAHIRELEEKATHLEIQLRRAEDGTEIRKLKGDCERLARKLEDSREEARGLRIDAMKWWKRDAGPAGRDAALPAAADSIER
jgi:hypothetical protein